MYSQKRILILAGIFLFYAVALLLSFNLHLDEKITTMLPDKDSEVKDFIYTLDHLPLLDALYIDVSVTNDNLDGDLDEASSKNSRKNSNDTPDEKSRELLKQTADRFYGDLEETAFFKDILYKISARDLLNLVDLIHQKQNLLLDKADVSALKTALEKDNLLLSFFRIKQELMGPVGLFSAESIRKDPLKITEMIMKKLEPLKAMTPGVRIDQGRITSADQKHILMVAHPHFPAVDTENGKKLVKFLNLARKNNETKTIEIGFSGAHVATLDNSLTIQGDVKQTIAVLSIAILVLGALFFRQKWFVLLIFFPAGFGLTFSSAMMCLYDTKVSAIALGCGAVLVGITVDFGIHLLFHLDQKPQNSKQAIPLFATLARPLATCSVTTALALFSLVFSSIPGQRQMGIFAGIGVLAAALFARFGLIYFIPFYQDEKFNQKKSAPILPLVEFCSNLLKAKQKNKKGVMIALLILLLVSSLGIPKFTFQGDISALNHLSKRVKKDRDLFLSTWGNTLAVTAMVEADTVQKALEKNDYLNKICKNLEQQGLIRKTASIAGILPSIQTQENNLQFWNNLWNPGMVEKTKKEFELQGKANGFARNIFKPFFETIAGQVSVIKPDDFKTTAIQDLINSRMILTKKGSSIVVTTFEALPGTDIAVLKALLKKDLPGIVVFDSGYFNAHLARTVSSEFMKIAVIAVSAILFSLFLFMKNLKLVVAAVLPVVLGGYLTLGFLGLFNIPINLISILFIVFVFGVGVDFSVFMIHQRILDIGNYHNVHKNYSLNEKDHKGETKTDLSITCGSVIICAMTTIAAFGALMTANHKALFSIGAAGLMGMVSCLVISLVVIPLLPAGMFRTRDS